MSNTGVPMKGDRSARDVINYPAEHASDLENGADQIHHLPAPRTPGNIAVDDGTKWVSQANPVGGAIADHDHSGDTGDGGTFDAANLTSWAASDGDVLTADGSGGAAWEAPTGGSGGGTVLRKIWCPDAPAPTPSALDDEFDDLSLNAKWTEFDPANIQTVTENAQGLILDNYTNNNGYSRVAGIYQPVIADVDQTYYTKVALTWPMANLGCLGIALWENAADTTKKIMLYGWWFDGGKTYLISSAYNDYTSDPNHYNYIPIEFNGLRPTEMYIRIRITQSTHVAVRDYSLDGYAWYNFQNNAINFTPAHVGLGSMSKYEGVHAKGRFTFFRRRLGNDLLDVLEGQRIALMAP